MPRLVAFSALLVLAACADSEPPDPTPADDDGAYNMIDPVTTQVTQDTAPAIGNWTRTMQDERPALAFGPTGAEPLFSLRCDEREGILLNRHGVVETGSAGMMTLTLGGDQHRLAVDPVAGPLPMLRATVSANDPVLDALGAQESPLELEVGDGPPLVLPPSPMIGAFISACGRGETPSLTSGNEDADNATNAAAPADETP